MRLTAHTVRTSFKVHGSSMSSFVGLVLLFGLPPYVRVGLLVTVQVENNQVVPCVCSTVMAWAVVVLVRFFYHCDCAFG